MVDLEFYWRKLKPTKKIQEKNGQPKTVLVQIVEDEGSDDEINEIMFKVNFLSKVKFRKFFVKWSDNDLLLVLTVLLSGIFVEKLL